MTKVMQQIPEFNNKQFTRATPSDEYANKRPDTYSRKTPLGKFSTQKLYSSNQ